MNLNRSAQGRVLVINGNPSRDSFCSVLAEEAAKTARSQGAEVRLIQLEDMAFDPDLKDGYRSRKTLEPDLAHFQAAITWCDTFVLIHPLWWGSPPAKLKGLFDRAFLPGFAFRYIKGKALPEKLLGGRTARVLVTSDTPPFFLWLLYRNAWLSVLKRQILNFTGLKVTKLKAIGPMRDAKPGASDKWLAAARALVA
jgi:NAD(P)H dehydrogenase (quinone)